MWAWKTWLSLAPVVTVSIRANRICSFVLAPTTSCFQSWWKQWVVYGSQDQTAKDSSGGKGRYEHSTLAIELLAGWEVQTSYYNSYNAGPHGTLVQMLNVRLKMFWGLDSLIIIIIKYFSSESHMLSLAIFLLRKTTLFQMFLSWQIATLPAVENGCILPVHACACPKSVWK